MLALPPRLALLKKHLRYFSGVSTVDPASVRWDVHLQRARGVAYGAMLELSRFVLENVFFSENDGRRKICGFSDERALAGIYEKFIREYYRQNSKKLGILNANADEIQWDAPDRKCLPKMKTDVTLWLYSKKLIIDAKFYGHNMQERYGKLSFISAHIYQIFAYVKNMAVQCGCDVAGMLLYARTKTNFSQKAGTAGRAQDATTQDDAAQDEFKPGDYCMNGSRISFRTLYLDRDFSEIEKQLITIANDFVRPDAKPCVRSSLGF